MYIIPSTPLTCSSIGAATVSRTVCAFAPGYTAVTCTVGGVTSGYCATGSVNTATPPASTKTTEMTVAKIGRSTKKRTTSGPHHVWDVGPGAKAVTHPRSSTIGPRGPTYLVCVLVPEYLTGGCEACRRCGG